MLYMYRDVPYIQISDVLTLAFVWPDLTLARSKCHVNVIIPAVYREDLHINIWDKFDVNIDILPFGTLI